MADESKDAPSKEKNVISDAVTVAAYPTALATGMATADVKMRAHTYKTFRSHGIPELEALKAGEDKIFKDAVRKELHTPNGALSQEIRDIRDVYRKDISGFFKSIGVNSWKDYWKIISRNEKWETGIFAITAASITLGALLTVANSQRLFDFLPGKRGKNDGQSPEK